MEDKTLSHLCHVQTQLKDPKALEAAAKALGVELVQNATARFYFGVSPVCEYVLKLPGRYDLGLKKQADGTYSFVADEELIGGRSGTDGYGRADPGRKILGEDCRRLKQEYAYAILAAEARRKGRQIQRQELPNGQIRVIMQGRK
jgi:Protein of unknown function (DUF1257)